MNTFTLITKNRLDKNNPFIIEILDSLPKIMGENFYLIESAELAFEYFPNLHFSNNKISDKIYWFNNINELEELIIEILSNNVDTITTIYDIRNFVYGNTLYYYEILNNVFYFLTDNKIYLIDFNIINMIEQVKLDINFFDCNLISFNDILVPLKELDLLDENYSLENYRLILNKYNKQYLILLFMQSVFLGSFNSKFIYNFDNEFNNPYQNILEIEKYFNNIEINTIDIQKCIDYDLKFGDLPAKYNYNGFYTTTGRIFCSSEEFSPIQNVAKSKRDILYAEENCFLIEIDFKSFELDLLSQILSLPITEDPHIEIYNRLVNIDTEFNIKRGIGKTINYAFIYGVDGNRLADKIIDELKIKDVNFKNLFLEKLKIENIMIKSKEFSLKLEYEMKNNIIRNYYGRNILCKKSFAVLNNYISSTAADLLYNKILQVIPILKDKNKILFQNHDSILLQLDNKSINDGKTLNKILDIMESPLSNLKGRISYTYGKNWKDLS